MDLKLTYYARNTYFFISQKSGYNSDIWNFLAKKKKKQKYQNNFGLCMADNRHFQIGYNSLHHYDVIRETNFMFLASM